MFLKFKIKYKDSGDPHSKYNFLLKKIRSRELKFLVYSLSDKKTVSAHVDFC